MKALNKTQLSGLNQHNRITAWGNDLLVITSVTIAYIIAGQLGFLFAIEGNASPIWIPAGIALMGMLFFGRIAGIGIFIGSFYGNITTFFTPQPTFSAIVVSVAIGLGAVLQAYIGVYLLKRFVTNPFDPFRSVRDTLIFSLLISFGVSLINATIGATSVTLGGFASLSHYGITWMAWWLGDSIGVMIFGSVLLIWRHLPHFNLEHIPELLAWVGIFAVLLAVSNWLRFPAAYFLLPPILLLIVRFERYGSTMGILVTYGLSLRGILQGTSMLVRPNLYESMILLDTFTATLGITAFIIVAMLEERRTSQNALRAANADLEKRVEARTIELLEAKDAAEAANLAKSRFISTMSHELRTPLTAIMGFTELQLMGLTGDLTSEQRMYQERVYSNAQDLLKLINEVLDISKIDSDRLELYPAALELRSWLTKITAQLAVLAERKGLLLTEQVAEDVPRSLITDSDRLKQIVVNLLSNAVKFTEKGEVGLSIHLHPQDPCLWQIEVRDTGIGIPEHLHEVIFEEFQQVDSSITRKYSGTGLGLAIVRRLVTLMGGKIAVQSRLDVGSTFTVTLPLIK